MPQVVTVFGGSGFIGRYVVRELAKAGYRVRVAVRRPNLASYVLVAGQVGQIQVVKCDVHDSEDVAAALRGADHAINLVGVLQSFGRQSFTALHVAAARTIANAAAEHGLDRLIHFSAIGAAKDSASSYAASKALGEEAVRAAMPGATILRPSIVFGPEDQFFNRFAAMARFAPVLPLIGGGTTRFQPVFVGDVARAACVCLNNPATAAKTYELGGPDIYSFKQLMQIMLRVICRRRLLLPVPFGVAGVLGSVLRMLPNAPITADQVRLLKTDNVVGADAPSLADLGIEPDSAEAILPSYLWRFRPHGQYEREAAQPVT
ncbi:MAG: complex I NDUFA9 subunit family protein [Alphaproteobacteria bacterium]|nr:complex I NDUFA9 subunit family protein [Alphaproteobacteria bacterium]